MNGHDSSGPDGASTDRDLRLWLVSKLEDKWPKLVTLNRDVLQAAVQIFQTLEAPLKVKLLFACIMAKNDMPVHDLLHNLFEVAKKDDDEWVRVVASLLCTHETGVLNFDYLLENPTSKAVLEKLKEVGSAKDTPVFFAPECPYLSTSVLEQQGVKPPVAGQPHFMVKKKSTRLNTFMPILQSRKPQASPRTTDPKAGVNKPAGNLRVSGSGVPGAATKPLASSSGLFAPKRARTAFSPAKRREREIPASDTGMTAIIDNDEEARALESRKRKRSTSDKKEEAKHPPSSPQPGFMMNMNMQGYPMAGKVGLPFLQAGDMAANQAVLQARAAGMGMYNPAMLAGLNMAGKPGIPGAANMAASLAAMASASGYQPGVSAADLLKAFDQKREAATASSEGTTSTSTAPNTSSASMPTNPLTTNPSLFGSRAPISFSSSMFASGANVSGALGIGANTATTTPSTQESGTQQQPQTASSAVHGLVSALSQTGARPGFGTTTTTTTTTTTSQTLMTPGLSYNPSLLSPSAAQGLNLTLQKSLSGTTATTSTTPGTTTTSITPQSYASLLGQQQQLQQRMMQQQLGLNQQLQKQQAAQQLGQQLGLGQQQQSAQQLGQQLGLGQQFTQQQPQQQAGQQLGQQLGLGQQQQAAQQLGQQLGQQFTQQQQQQQPQQAHPAPSLPVNLAASASPSLSFSAPSDAASLLFQTLGKGPSSNSASATTATTTTTTSGTTTTPTQSPGMLVQTNLLSRPKLLIQPTTSGAATTLNSSNPLLGISLPNSTPSTSSLILPLSSPTGGSTPNSTSASASLLLNSFLPQNHTSTQTIPTSLPTQLQQQQQQQQKDSGNV